MTYKEHFERLSYEYEQASKEFHKFRGRLSKTRQHKLGQMSKYSIAKHRFEETSKSYWAFLNFWASNQLDPHDEYRADYLIHKIYLLQAGKSMAPPQFNMLN